MKPRIRTLIERCIETGLERGYRQAHKHTETPSQDGLLAAMEDAIWLELDTYLDFEE